MFRNDENLDIVNKTRHGQVTGQADKVLEQGVHHSYFSTTPRSKQHRGNISELPKGAEISEKIGFDACPWIDEYIAFSRKWSPESYDGYHEACGLAILSTVAAGRVVFDLGGLRKTNLNILLIGRTSIHAKSTASNIAKDLLISAGLDWLMAPDETTPQKLIEDMSSICLPENYDKLGVKEQQSAINRVLTAGQQGWFIDEFGSNIAAMMQTDGVMAGIRGLIRTLEGAPPKYEYRTVSRGTNLIKNPYLPILGNITIADFAPYTRRGNALWLDGFLARFVTVTPPIDFLRYGRFPNQQMVFPASLISPLENWNDHLGFPNYKIEGLAGNRTLKFEPITPMHLKISTEVFDAYYALHDALRMMIVKSQNHDLDGNYARFPEKELRIAAIFASFGNSDTIHLSHWAKAQAIVERWRVGLHEFYQQVTEANQDSGSKYIKDLPVEDQIIRAIKKRKMLTSREISQFTGFKMDIIDPALLKLVNEGKVLRINQKIYLLP